MAARDFWYFGSALAQRVRLPSANEASLRALVTLTRFIVFCYLIASVLTMPRKCPPIPLIDKNPLVFRRKREEGGLLDYAEETHGVQRFLDKIHPIRDESRPPKSGFSYR